MPIRKIDKIKAWSFSRFDTYRKCSRQAKFKYIDKIKEEKSDAMKRGIRIHKEAEKYSTGQINKMPESLKLFPDEFKALRKIKNKLQVEQELAVDKNWNSCRWRDWNKAWLRVKMDCMFVMSDPTILKVIDYKTGKYLDYHTGQPKTEALEQLDLYAVFGFLFGGAQIETIEAELWYLDHGVIIGGEGENEPKIFTREKDEKRLIKEWSQKTKRMLNDTVYKANPGEACRFCPFRKDKGGQCKF